MHVYFVYRTRERLATFFWHSRISFYVGSCEDLNKTIRQIRELYANNLVAALKNVVATSKK
jgi:hypothetical protein